MKDEAQVAVGVAMQATDDINGAVARFRAALPGWWFTTGRCGLTCHASVGPDRFFVPQPYLDKYDAGFHADIPNPTTCEVALDEAVREAVEKLTAEGDYQTLYESSGSKAKLEEGK